jgi:vacuolar protein sorting-associated protein 13A/C
MAFIEEKRMLLILVRSYSRNLFWILTRYPDIVGGDNVVLLTSSRILSFWSKKLRLDWELPFADVQNVATEDTGIHFSHKAGRGHSKFVFVPDQSSRSWFFDEVASVVKAFNIRRRMDV